MISQGKRKKMDDLTVVQIFDYWKAIMGHPRARMDAARKKAIAARLRDGYTIDDLMLAIDGCSASAFHMGENDRGQRYDSITLILRDADHVDKFIRAGELAHKIAAARVDKQQRDTEINHAQNNVSDEQKQKVRDMLASVKLKKVV